MPYCLALGADALAVPAWGAAPPPWAPGRREETHRMIDHDDVNDPGHTWCISEVDIFRDLPEPEMDALATRIDTPAGKLRPGARHPQIALTHEQLAALAGTSRETCTKVLREFADRGLLRLARGRITVLDPARLLDEAG
ncbi:helix-turn-helix domain-containing protein [Streptomyces sp. HC307]|uniref:helix-turn-helix domain-containing protein n=1 Tax=Streptomyces flavusporus TaxID=3385496 RepID=UPI0039172704